LVLQESGEGVPYMIIIEEKQYIICRHPYQDVIPFSS